jgi:hypothetical protein
VVRRELAFLVLAVAVCACGEPLPAAAPLHAPPAPVAPEIADPVHVLSVEGPAPFDAQLAARLLLPGIPADGRLVITVMRHETAGPNERRAALVAALTARRPACDWALLDGSRCTELVADGLMPDSCVFFGGAAEPHPATALANHRWSVPVTSAYRPELAWRRAPHGDLDAALAEWLRGPISYGRPSNLRFAVVDGTDPESARRGKAQFLNRAADFCLHGLDSRFFRQPVLRRMVEPRPDVGPAVRALGVAPGLLPRRDRRHLGGLLRRSLVITRRPARRRRGRASR